MNRTIRLRNFSLIDPLAERHILYIYYYSEYSQSRFKNLNLEKKAARPTTNEKLGMQNQNTVLLLVQFLKKYTILAYELYVTKVTETAICNTSRHSQP
jgi:hypothetical protein